MLKTQINSKAVSESPIRTKNLLNRNLPFVRSFSRKAKSVQKVAKKGRLPSLETGPLGYFAVLQMAFCATMGIS